MPAPSGSPELKSCLRLLAAALACATALAAGAAERTVLVFGDSLSAAYGLAAREGWVALLGEKLARERPGWRAVNASVSGETTAGGLRRLPEDLKRHAPAVVVIALGANDGLRGLPLEATRANLEAMIRLSREARAEPVLVGLMLPPNYGIDYAREFQALFPAAARKARAPLVPFLLEGIAEKRELFQADQLHPTAAAQPAILANVWPVLEPLLKKAPPKP